MIKFNENENHLTCVFDGALDTNACTKFEDELAAKILATKKDIIFDLKGVKFVSSSFLRICLKAAKDRGKEHFKLMDVPIQVMKVLKIAEFDHYITID